MSNSLDPDQTGRKVRYDLGPNYLQFSLSADGNGRERVKEIGLPLCLPMLSADNLGKQFAPRSGPTNRPALIVGPDHGPNCLTF